MQWFFPFSFVLCFWKTRPAQISTVEIVQDETILYHFDSNNTKNQEIEISYNVRINTILIENGKICIVNADCPDNTCVCMGWLKSEALPIICLSNHLVIQYAQSGEAYEVIRDCISRALSD